MKTFLIGFGLSLLAVNMASAKACDSACSFGPGVAGTLGLVSPSFTFNIKQTGATVDSPTYTAPSGTVKGIVPASGIPVIHIGVHPTGSALGTNGEYTLHLIYAFAGAAPTLTGQHLFIVSGTGLPLYVSGWSTSIGLTMTLDIKLEQVGSIDLMFGSFPSGQTGVVVSPAATAAVFDFANPQTQMLPITGAGFRTANPFVLATPILAGGKVSTSILSSNYPLKSTVGSVGIHSLGANLKAERLKSFYAEMARADDQTGVPTGETKPFQLVVSDTSNLLAAVGSDTDLAVNSTLGLITSGALPLQLTTTGWKSLGQVSRSIEVVLTVFDGGTLSRGKIFVRSKFRSEGSSDDIRPLDKPAQPFASSRWNFFTYPWDEAAGGKMGRVVNDSNLSGDDKVTRFNGVTAAYEVLTDSNFSAHIDSGRAFWNGNAAFPYKPVTAGGTSLDYKTFTIPLLAGKWNDFGVPFNFPVKLKDVAGTDSASLGGHHIWHFTPGGIAGSWDTVSLKSGVLLPWNGYTVSPGVNTVDTLKFTVRDSSRSTTVLSKTASDAPVWEALLVAEDKTASSKLRLSKASTSDGLEEGPLVPGQDFRAVFVSGGSRWSAIRDNSQGVEGHWPLEVIPGKGFSGLKLRLSAQSGASVPLYLVETVQQKTLAIGDSGVQISAQELQQGDYHIVAGGQEYVQSFLNSVGNVNQLRVSNFPNPFSSNGTSIHFSLPSTFSDVQYRLTIFDLQGHRVWEKSSKSGPVLNLFWDGKDRQGNVLPGGQYSLMLTAQVPGKSVFHAQRQLIKLQ